MAVKLPSVGLMLAIVVGMGAVTWLGVAPNSAPSWLHSAGLFIFRSNLGLRILAGVAWTAHLLEAMLAASKASRLGEPVLPWSLVTFLFGFGTLRYLIAMEKKGKRKSG